jgi:hypothetical protein
MEKRWNSKTVMSDMRKRAENNEFGNSYKWVDLYKKTEGIFPQPPHVRSVLWNSDNPSTTNPLTWEQWLVDGQRMFELATRALDKDFTPSWDMISFRQESDFYAGLFGDYLQLWLPVLKELEPPFRARAYSVLAQGVDVFENLKQIRYQDPVVFRGKHRIAMDHTEHCSNRTMFRETNRENYTAPKGKKVKDAVDIEGWPTFRNAKYPVHVGGDRHSRPLEIPNPRGTLKMHDVVADTLTKWTKTGALRLIDEAEPEPLMSSALILVPKGEGWRVCYDGSPLTFLETGSVTCKLDDVKRVMSTIRKGDVLLKLDDKSAFHHLLLDPMSSRMAAMKWGGLTFAYRAAAFGIPRIPSEYQLINSAPINYLRNRGHMILLYLDDRLIIERPGSEEERRNLLNGSQIPRSAFAICALASALGTVIHREKSTFLPTQRLEYLGFIFDTEHETIAIPQKKWDTFKAEVSLLLKQSHIPVKALERIRGKCVHFMYVERKMRLYIREQNDAIAQALERGGGTIAIYSRLRKELNRWLDPSLVQQEVKWIETGVCHIHIPLDLARRTLVYTDASGGAGGIFIDGLKIDEPFYWSKKMAPKNIYMKEAFAILVMLRKKGSLLKNRRLLVKCDNQIVCSAIYNGSKKSSELNDLILAIYDLARKHNIDLRANYVDTKNQLADEASRTFDYNESKISDKAFSELIAKWGMTPTVDAFAAEENARQRSYVSRFHDDGAWRVDFFQITKWRAKEAIYAFPPPKIADLTLKYLEKYAKHVPWALVLVAHETCTIPMTIARRNGWRLEKLESSPAVLRPHRRLSEEWDYYKPIAPGATVWVIFYKPQNDTRN